MERARAVWPVACILSAGWLSGCGSVSFAPITYIDATDGPAGNTRLATGGEFNAMGSPLIGNDNLWSKRPEGNGGTVFTTNDGRPSGPEDGPTLVTTISGLEPGGRYRVYAYFWSDPHNWQLKASLTPIVPPGNDPAVSFSRLGSPVGKAASPAHAGAFDGRVLVSEENRRLHQADLGVAAADANGEIRVWIDDLANAGHATRTWYDGVGVATSSAMPTVTRESVWAAVALAAVAATFFFVVRSLRRERGE